MNKPIHPAVAEHVMEENARLRGLLRLATDRWESWASEIIHTTPEYESELAEIARIRAALSQQPEPTDTYTAVDMATAAAQGFRDGQAAVEQAAAQDEREAEAAVKALLFSGRLVDSFLIRDICKAVLSSAPIAQAAPQPEQSGLPDVCDGKEQEAFEEFARGERMDTTTHPLHWLFLNEKTNAARQGWKAAIRYCRAALSAQGESHE